MSLAGSARYLISPLVAGLLLSISDVKLLLIIDISTFVLTVISTAVVKKGIETKSGSEDKSFMESLKEGWNVVHSKQGIFLLILVSAVMTLFLGVFQILAEPLILSFADSKTLGIGETVCACGMLVSSLILGVRGIKKRYVKVLAISLMCAGLFMIGFGIWENIFVICGFGFLFFAMLPFANNCLDYLVRTNIPDKLQGRAWGFIGFLSQMGYVIAYGAGGLLADLAAKLLDTSIGRGAGMVIMISGVCLSVVAVMMARIKSIQDLEMGKVLNSQKKEESY